MTGETPEVCSDKRKAREEREERGSSGSSRCPQDVIERITERIIDRNNLFIQA